MGTDDSSITIVSGATTNAYLLKADTGWLLVDTGYAGDGPRLLKALRKRGVSVADLAFLFLTHHHDDHAGLVHYLTEANPGLRVIVHSEAVPLLERGHNDTGEPGFWLNRHVRFLARANRLFKRNWNLRFPPYRIRPNDIVIDRTRDTETLPSLGVDGTILATPGHTRDSMSIVRNDGSAIVGDAAADFLGFAGTHHCVLYLCDLARYYESWRTLIREGAQHIYPAHGRPFPVAALSAEMGRCRSDALVPFDPAEFGLSIDGCSERQ